MGVCKVTAEEIQKHLPARILSLGYPDHLVGNVDLTGSVLESVDLFAHRGTERIADLSLPQELGSYDLVIDCGTIEHCANPAQAFINAASAVAVGGRILHHLPLSMINHGYWNLCPVWFTDFYGHNEFVIERMDMTNNGSYEFAEVIPWPDKDPNLNMYALPDAALILVVARRTNGNPITLPKCQKMWEAGQKAEDGGQKPDDAAVH